MPSTLKAKRGKGKLSEQPLQPCQSKAGLSEDATSTAKGSAP